MATKAKTATKKKPAAKKAATKKPAASRKNASKTLTPAEKAALAAQEEARKLEKEAKAAAKKAEAEAKKAAAAAKKEAEKAKAEAEAKRFQAATTKALATTAKEINHRISEAAKLVGKADDHRLAAAIRLDEAKGKCREAKINFKDWCEENVKQSYETVRKLLPIGAAENDEPGAGQKLLADMRNKNKKANKEARERKKSEGGSKPAKDQPAAVALDAIKKLPKDQATKLIKSQAEALGVGVGEDTKAEKRTTREVAEDAFGRLGAKAKLAFAHWVAEQVGGTLSVEGEASEEEGDPLDIPDSMKR